MHITVSSGLVYFFFLILNLACIDSVVYACVCVIHKCAFFFSSIDLRMNSASQLTHTLGHKSIPKPVCHRFDLVAKKEIGEKKKAVCPTAMK